ncbi:MAG: hypothetical protein IM638_07715 [Bacteroidetes bacterium]|nr:hypothetical protein [Bacteroidota bacterium]
MHSTHAHKPNTTVPDFQTQDSDTVQQKSSGFFFEDNRQTNAGRSQVAEGASAVQLKQASVPDTDSGSNHADFSEESASMQQPSGYLSDHRLTGVVQRVIGPGGMLNRGKKVIRKDGKKFVILNDHVFRGQLEYLLGDDDGNEFYVQADNPAYDLFDPTRPPAHNKQRVESSDEADELDNSDGFSGEDVHDSENGTSSEDSELSDDDLEKGKDKAGSSAPVYVKKEWDKASALKRLSESKPTEPIPEEELADLNEWFNTHLSLFNRRESAGFRKAIGKAKEDSSQYFATISSVRPAPSRKRKNKGEKAAVNTFDNVADSELSDDESEPDTRLKKYPAVMGAVSGRSHVYGIDDNARFHYLVTGLPYADTYLMLFKNGRLVPRSINGQANIRAIRKRMRDVWGKIKPSLVIRDNLFAQLKKLNDEVNSKNLKGEKLIACITERDRVYKELQQLLSTSIRPHVEGILFGSSSNAGATPEEIEKTQSAAKARESIKADLLKEKIPTAASELIGGAVPKGLTTGFNTSTHAEQTTISSVGWVNLINRLVASIKKNKNTPEQILHSSVNRLQLTLNRSTCVGCARELTAELIRFWIEVSKALGLRSWREAQYMFERYVSFRINFPAIYENDAEKQSDYKNLKRIISGLRDAGWTVVITTGVNASESSNQQNQAARLLVDSFTAVPRFYVEGWDANITGFNTPPSLTAVIGKNEQITVNGIRYHLTKSGNAFTRTDDEQVSLKDASGIKFNQVGVQRATAVKPKPGGDSSDDDSSEGTHSSSDDSSLSSSESENDDWRHEPHYAYPTGRIEHILNSCYIAAIVHLFASHNQLLQLFDRDVPLEDDPLVDINLRRQDQARGMAIQQNSRIGQLATRLRKPDAKISKYDINYVMTFLGQVGQILPANEVIVPVKALESSAKAKAEKLVAETTPVSVSSSTSSTSKKVEPMVVDVSTKPASWGVQQDAAEVLTRLLQYLRPDNNITIGQNSHLGAAHDNSFGPSDHNINETTLQLEINSDAITSIPDALRHYSRVEPDVDYRQKRVTKQVRFNRLPNVLIINLKRFLQTPQGRIKLNKAVTAPLLLTIPPVCLTGVLAGQNIRYRLIHFSSHEGKGFGGGHYTSFVRSNADSWHKHDDIHGRSVPDHETFTQAKNTSYIYVYELVP